MLLERVIVFSNDPHRLADFYGSAFGLEPVGERSLAWIEFDAGGCSLAFHRVDEHSASRDGWVKLVFGTANVAGEKARLESLGIQMSDITNYQGIELCDGRDPDGNYFQISSRGV